MSTLADAVGASLDFPFDGKTYKPTELDLVQLGRFSTWLVERAKAFAAIGVTTAEADADRAKINADAAAGLYDVGSVTFFNATRTPAGAAMLLLLSLEKNHPEADLTLTQRMIAANVSGSADLLAQVSPDPKASRASSARGAHTKTGRTSSRRFGTKGGRSKK